MNYSSTGDSYFQITTTNYYNYITSTEGTKNFKQLYCFMVQERQPLSKAFKHEILFEMPKKFKMVVT